MFPDIRSHQKENPAPKPKRDIGGTLLLIAGGVLIVVVYFSSMMKMAEFGLVPGVTNYGMAVQLPRPMAATSAAPVIPVTGAGIANLGSRLYLDTFTAGTKDWSTLSGAMHHQDSVLMLSPNLLGFGGTAVWNFPDHLLPERFAFSARINTDAEFGQLYGLGINLGNDTNGVLFALDPFERSTAILLRENGVITALSNWQVSDAVLPYPETNLLTAECDFGKVFFFVNNTLTASADYTQSCTSGEVGVFVRSPGWMIRVADAELYELQ